MAPLRDEVECCYAVQDKVWVDGPDREPWEIYTVLGEADTMGCTTAPESAAHCC